MQHMKERFISKRKVRQIFLSLLLVLVLVLSASTTVLASENDVLPEIRSLLQTQYVDPVSNYVLDAPTVEETLNRLGDPHTDYFAPTQYQNFVGSINNSFAGIGVQVSMVPEGVKVVAVIANSPAQDVGLQSGDIIIRADDQSLAGLTQDDAVNLLRGQDGSVVQITVKRGTATKDYSITRRTITEPTVNASVLDGHIGYLQISSFGESTPMEFEQSALYLANQGIDSWIVDLRDNGGGYLSSAIDIAGFFVGPQVAVQVKDRSGVLHLDQAPEEPFTLKQSIMFLTNENTASASEILTSVVKDYKKALVVGTTTYGKGSVQTMFPLSNGGVFKMTVDHFFSPFGHTIDKVGITPDVLIQDADSLKAAELMLADQSVALTKATTPEYWAAWRELMDPNNPPPYTVYYPYYRQVSNLSEVPLDKKFTVHFNEAVNWSSVNDSSVELINSRTGERVPTKFETLGPSDVQVIPQVSLKPDTTYWLVVHPTILDNHGKTLKEGTVVIAHTLKEAGSQNTEKIQSLDNAVINGQFPGKSKINSNRDYGWAIIDLVNQKR